MPIKTFLLLFAGLAVAFTPLSAQPIHPSEKQAWLGEPAPGRTPKLFAPGRVSDGMSNRDMAISPAGDEYFYTVQAAYGQVSMLLTMHFIPRAGGAGGTWSGPEVAPFSGKYGDLEPAFSASGDSLYFASNRPANGGSELKDYDIWMVKKSNGKWGEPTRLDSTINTSKNEFYPSVARNGNLYFTRNIENGKGNEDIVVSEWKNGRYQPVNSLPDAINSDKAEFNAYVDPDEKFLLFSSFGRKDDLGGGDLYLSCKNEQGEWMPAVHFDSTINSEAIDFCPYVSPDKKYFFFTSGKMTSEQPFAKPLHFRGLRQLLEGPGNGLNDIYWMEWKPLLEKYFPARPAAGSDAAGRAISSGTIIPLYPDSIPNSRPSPDQEESEINKEGLLIISKISRPTLSLFYPPAALANGTAVIICPGGGYWVEAAGHEGADVAKKLNEMGITAILLKYRIPSDETMVNREIGPLQDAQQAIKMAREHARAWHIDPSRIGIMGFSAGGHLAATAGTHFTKALIPNKENTSLRPDFLILAYPVISCGDAYGHKGSCEQLIGKTPSAEKIREYSNELQVTDSTAPTFLVLAGDDDGVSPLNSISFYEALLEHHVPAELHIYQNSGHGFGLHLKNSKEEWIERCRNWMQGNGWLTR
jgi:acetyl esterase/lipase